MQANTTSTSWPQTTDSFMSDAEGPPGGRWKDVQAELERFRKLFEFIEGVLPQDAAEAMKFFGRKFSDGPDLARTVTDAFGPEVDFERQKSKLENDFNERTLSIQREFENLSVVLKGLQRDSETTSSKILDLGNRMMHREHEAKDIRMASPFTSMEEQPLHEPSPREPAVPAAPEMPGDVVLQPSLDKSMEDLREDVKQWLDMLRSSVLAALQTKADTEQVMDFIKQVTGQNDLALFAKRSLLGKCASCETPIEADLLRVKRPQPIALQTPFPTRGDSLGAQVAIRPLNAGASPQPTASSHGKLPKISDRNGRSEFPKSKVLKGNASSPDLRKDHE